MTRRALTLLVVVTFLGSGTPTSAAQRARGAPPVVFVHGMGSPAGDIGIAGPGGAPGPFQSLMERIAADHPRPGVCQRDAQPGRSWDGNPCVFRYVEDASETDEGPNDSQSAVRDNSEKLAREVAEVALNAGRGVVLIGYSMGGAIIRAYLADHREEAEHNVDAVVLLDAVASGAWGYAFAGAVPRRLGGGLGDHVGELMRSLAASASAVDLDRPATRDLSPRSDLFRDIAGKPLPRTLSYYTFWGDIRMVIGRRLLHYELPDFTLPRFGDFGLLPGDPDPGVLPELGGQRFSPEVDEGEVSLDIPHRARVELGAEVVGQLIMNCGHAPRGRDDACARLVRRHFDIPNTHMAIPLTIDRVEVDEPVLGGRVTVLEAMLAAIGRHR